MIIICRVVSSPIPSNRLKPFDVTRKIHRIKRKSVIRIDTGTKNIGLTMAITIRNPSMLRTLCVASSIVFGRISSIALEMIQNLNHILLCEMKKLWKDYPRSFENRLIILPAGFKSKNRMDVATIPSNIILWMLCEIRVQIA